MWELMIRVVNAAEMYVIVGWFVASVVLQGVILTLMIPFLRALYTRSEPLTDWLVAVMMLGMTTFIIGAIAVFRLYRMSVFEVCGTMIDRVAEHVLALPLGWFNAKHEATVVNATSKEVNILSHLRSMVTPNLCSAFVVPPMMPVAVGIVGRPLALIMVVAIVPLYLVWRTMRSAIIRINEMKNQAAAATVGRFVEFACLQPVLWVTGASEKGWEPMQEILEANSKAALDGLRIKGRPGQFFTLVLNATFAVVLVPGLSFVNEHRLDVVAYLAIVTVVAWMLLPLTKSVLYASETDDAVVAFEAIVSILDAKPLPGPSPE